MSKYFYAVEFRSGRHTTTGENNPRTMRMSRAVWPQAFKTTSDRAEWIADGKVTSDMGGNNREAVTKKQLRGMCLGMSMEEFKEHIEYLQTNAELDFKDQT